MQITLNSCAAKVAAAWCLRSIAALLVEADTGLAVDKLPAESRATGIPNLRRFPRIGRRYLTNSPRSAGALARLDTSPARAPDALREYLHGHNLMLYTVVEAPLQTGTTVHLLSFRHHRHLSFDFTRLWPGA